MTVVPSRFVSERFSQPRQIAGILALFALLAGEADMVTASRFAESVNLSTVAG